MSFLSIAKCHFFFSEPLEVLSPLTAVLKGALRSRSDTAELVVTPVVLLAARREAKEDINIT